MSKFDGKWFTIYSGIEHSIFLAQVVKSRKDTQSSIITEVLVMKNVIRVQLEPFKIIKKDEYAPRNPMFMKDTHFVDQRSAQKELLMLTFKHL